MNEQLRHHRIKIDAETDAASGYRFHAARVTDRDRLGMLGGDADHGIEAFTTVAPRPSDRARRAPEAPVRSSVRGRSQKHPLLRRRSTALLGRYSDILYVYSR